MGLLPLENILKCHSRSALCASKLYEYYFLQATCVTHASDVCKPHVAHGAAPWPLLACTFKVDNDASHTSGFRSLCTTPRECMKLTAEMRFLIIWLASLSVKRSFLLILSSSSPPRNSSKTRYVWACKTRITNCNNCVQLYATFWSDICVTLSNVFGFPQSQLLLQLYLLYLQLHFLSYFNTAFYLTQSLIFITCSYCGFKKICKNPFN